MVSHVEELFQPPWNALHLLVELLQDPMVVMILYHTAYSGVNFPYFHLHSTVLMCNQAVQDPLLSQQVKQTEILFTYVLQQSIPLGLERTAPREEIPVVMAIHCHGQ